MEQEIITEEVDYAVQVHDRAEARRQAIADCCNKWLRKSRYTKRVLYERCVQEHILDVDAYAQFERTLEELIANFRVDATKIMRHKKRSKNGQGGHKEFTHDEMLRIAQKIVDKGDVITAIQVAICEIAGLRNLSVNRLKACDINLTTGEIYVQAIKDSPAGWVVMIEPLARLLKLYMQFAHITRGDTLLFPSPVEIGKHLKPKSFYERFKGILVQAGLHDNEQSYYVYDAKKGVTDGMKKRKYWYSVHSLRHTCGTAWLEKTNDLSLVQRQLLHNSPETTAIYANRNLKNMRGKMEAAYRGEITRTWSDLEMKEKGEVLRKVMKEDDNRFDRKVAHDEKMMGMQLEMKRIDGAMAGVKVPGVTP